MTFDPAGRLLRSAIDREVSAALFILAERELQRRNREECEALIPYALKNGVVGHCPRGPDEIDHLVLVSEAVYASLDDLQRYKIRKKVQAT